MKTEISTSVAMVTGAASGLGKELATQLAAMNYTVVCVDYNADGLRALEAELKAASRSAHCVQTNIVEREDVVALMQRVNDVYGRLDLLINNAGVMHRFSRIDRLGREFAERVFDVNFWGTTNMTLEALPLLRKSKAPLLVNVASIGAVLPTIGQGFYGASKAASVQLTRALALELEKEDIDVMLVFPGAMDTNIFENSQHTEGDESHKEMVGALKSGKSSQRWMMTPAVAARRIVSSLDSRPRRLFVGIDAKLLGLMNRVMPETTTRLFAKVMRNAPAMGDALK